MVNHRQLAFVIINSLLGNKLQDVETGPEMIALKCILVDYNNISYSIYLYLNT